MSNAIPFVLRIRTVINDFQLTIDIDAPIARVWAITLDIEHWPEWTSTVIRAKVHGDGLLKLGAVAQPLRAALTGRSTSPGIYDVLCILGREESLSRLRDQAGL